MHKAGNGHRNLNYSSTLQKQRAANALTHSHTNARAPGWPRLARSVSDPVDFRLAQAAACCVRARSASPGLLRHARVRWARRGRVAAAGQDRAEEEGCGGPGSGHRGGRRRRADS